MYSDKCHVLFEKFAKNVVINCLETSKTLALCMKVKLFVGNPSLNVKSLCGLGKHLKQVL